jgi:uncharacterized membrane protein
MRLPSMRMCASASAILLASTAPSWAYLDPGTGSLLLQSAIAAIAAAAATVSFYWTKTKHLVSKMFKRRDHHGEKKDR